ncbi:MAG: hypothetical protein F7C81_03185 [Desulfurococcales archaeon]|nr:hypothetical protein [Desulfurococcales archaeon]
MMEARIVDFRKIEEKCNLPKIEALQTYILNNARPGETLEVIVGDADTWYAFTQLGETLGYKVLESRKEEDKYTIMIKIE